MKSIVYISTMNRLYLQPELLGLLRSFQINNVKYNITGVLLYHDGIIIQYIEGPSRMIDDVYNNIKNDNRHHNVTKLISEDITERLFPKWSMGFNTCRNLDEMEAFNVFLKNIDIDDLNLNNKQHRVNNLYLLFKSLKLLKTEPLRAIGPLINF